MADPGADSRTGPVAISALARHLVAGRHGRPTGAPGVTLEEVTAGSMAQLSGVADGDALHDALSAYSLDLPPAPLRCAKGPAVSVLWNGPGQYLAVSREHQGDELALSLATAVSDLGGVAVDLSHARTTVQLSGAACIEVLAKGCPLDIESMQPGDCAATLLGHFNVLLHRAGDQAFEIHVTRSFAVACFEWLVRASEEFGLQVR